MLFVVAHGKTEDGVYYFLPSDAVFTGDGKFDPRTAVNIDDLTGALDIPGRKLVFLDTCESGGVDNNRLVRTLKNRSTVIFTASRQEEYSYENALYGGGFFTHGITAGISGEAAEGGMVLIDKLGEYVMERVSRISRDRQHPEKFILDGYRDFVITVVE
ncbi:MAG: caspase family protein [Treponema sp.]|nr:caspase family protein [Treponema sp.]